MNKKVPHFVVTLICCLVCVVATAAATLVIGDKGATSDKYLEIIKILQEDSIGDVEAKELEDSSASAMVATLNDDWSYYLTDEEYSEYLLDEANQYLGIGVTTEYNAKYGYLSVTSVTADSPASRAQIEVGNLITTVNNTDVSDFTPDDLKGYLKSFGDQSFRLGLMNAQGGVRTVELTCQIIYAPPVTWRMEDNIIGYIIISNFDTGCCEYLKQAMSDLKDHGARSFLMDIRGNPGGNVEELAAVLDYLLPKGDLFICRDRNGKDTVYSSGSDSQNERMVVMINGKTENEAEMFALVMQSYGAATIVGERTSGNGHSQVVTPLQDGSAIRLSKYTFYSTERKSLEALGGVTPDIRSTAIADSSLDVILEAAKDVVS